MTAKRKTITRIQENFELAVKTKAFSAVQSDKCKAERKRRRRIDT